MMKQSSPIIQRDARTLRYWRVLVMAVIGLGSVYLSALVANDFGPRFAGSVSGVLWFVGVVCLTASASSNGPAWVRLWARIGVTFAVLLMVAEWVGVLAGWPQWPSQVWISACYAMAVFTGSRGHVWAAAGSTCLASGGFVCLIFNILHGASSRIGFLVIQRD